MYQHPMSTSHTKGSIVLVVALLAMISVIPMTAVEAQSSSRTTGTVTGQVVDRSSGESLPGVTVMLRGTVLGAMTDPDGFFTIKSVPVGTYSILATMVGYDSALVTSIIVEAGGELSLDLELNEVITSMDTTITVKAKRMTNTQATVLLERQKSISVSDGVSAEQISASGSSDAAQAVKKVVGASVVDGKHVYVRGLGGRYANTQLNGSPLPSPDPDEQTAPMDLVPAGMLDNIVVSKSFTPDRPGDFAGGSVDMTTKDYPSERSLVISTSAGYNSETTFKDNVLTQRASGSDWLGFDDGWRGIPDYVVNNPDQIENIPKLQSIKIPIEDYDDSIHIVQNALAVANSFNPEMRTSERAAPLNQSHSISYGDRISLFGAPLGIVSNLVYSRKISSRTGARGRYEWVSRESELLSPEYIADDVRGTDEVTAGGLLMLRYQLMRGHSVGWTYMYNRNGESVSRFLQGPDNYYGPGVEVRNWVLQYTERELKTNQFQGKHHFLGNKLEVEWQYSPSKTSQSEPDLRMMFDNVETGTTVDSLGNPVDILKYSIPGNLDRPKRLWRDIDEEGRDAKLDLTFRLTENTSVKTGMAYSKRERTRTERKFQYENIEDYFYYGDDPNSYLDNWVSDFAVDSVGWDRFRQDSIFFLTNTISEVPVSQNDYYGHRKVNAAYAMIDLPLTSRLKFTGGARYEETDMFALTESLDERNRPGVIDVKDWLPSLSLKYDLSDRMSVRSSLTRTLARPTLREMAPIATTEFATGEFFNGNPDLDMTRIRNFDVRWEWFVRPGEILSVSFFRKYIKNPIELAIVGDNFDVVVFNASDATNYGVEFEARRRLDWLHSWLANFSVGGNLTLVNSKVKLSDAELQEFQIEYPDSYVDYHPMAGQSPYIVNLDLNYNNYKTGTKASLFYNAFGERFAINAKKQAPDIYEQSRHQLDLVVSQKVFAGTTFKFSVKNILDEDVLFLHRDKYNVGGIKDEVYQQLSPGRDISFGVSYQVW